MPSEQLREVRLYSFLGKKFGKVHHFAISTPREAIQALSANYPDFEQAIRDHQPGFKITVGFEELPTTDGDYPVAPKEIVRIIPQICGSGFEAAVANVIWYVASMYSTNAFFAFVVNYLATMAISSVLSTAVKTPGPKERPENLPSYAFNGPVNTTAQGNPVAIGYGELIIGSQVINAGLYTEQI